MELSADIVVAGSGVGGAAIAKELAKKGKKPLVVEKGLDFSRKHFGSQLYASFNLYDKFGLWSRTREGVVYYRTIGVGGTSIVSCANGVRSLEAKLKNLGIDLSAEFSETEKELGINFVPEKFLGKGIRMIREAAKRVGVNMQPMPKFIDFDKCVSCGNCVLGCRTGAKWSALEYLKEARDNGASLVKGIQVNKVLVSDDNLTGIEGCNQQGQKVMISAKTVVLAAGGIGTAVILQRSGIKSGEKLFLDLFHVTLGLAKDAGLAKDVTMSVVSQHEGFILSPFLDCALALTSTLPVTQLIKAVQRKRLLGIMTKIEDETFGRVEESGKITKTVTPSDRAKLSRGAGLSREILIAAGVTPQSLTTTKIRGAHPGGTAAIGEVVDGNLETKIKGLFVCDASVLPVSPGLPPIVTIIALAKRLAKRLALI